MARVLHQRASNEACCFYQPRSARQIFLPIVSKLGVLRMVQCGKFTHITHP
ncbi:MAG: hypothetical protein XXXJIFNMEKO3_00331 [Candidatus Erwinia impunctatus]|nr:hypothetical protein XXXJIFNMEKO_00331 [Culicoides impunctatus]